MTLLNAKSLKAADKTGTSDPFVKFIVNGETVYKSAVIKKTLDPVWKDEKFEVPIVSQLQKVAACKMYVIKLCFIDFSCDS